MTQTVRVRKDALQTIDIVDADATALADGEVRLRVESFAVTANNVTYAVIGDMFGYWNFFPAPDGWGVVPMWGHAVVEESKHGEIAAGERVYGYLPMATHLTVKADRVGAGGFVDATDYRQPMSVFYNQYSRLAADPEHDPAREEARMIFGPLFKTGFLIESMFARENWFGADTLVMTSASSKTAMALAHCAKQTSPAIKRVGLTSVGNVPFVERTGLYDEVLSYHDLAALARRRAVAVDFAGNANVLRTIHEQVGDGLTYSCLVGATHVGGRGGSGEPMPGPAPTLFFAPDHASATVKALGPTAFAQAVGTSWQAFVTATDGFMKVTRNTGLLAASQAFEATLTGTASPEFGIVIYP